MPRGAYRSRGPARGSRASLSRRYPRLGGGATYDQRWERQERRYPRHHLIGEDHLERGSVRGPVTLFGVAFPTPPMVAVGDGGVILATEAAPPGGQRSEGDQLLIEAPPRMPCTACGRRDGGDPGYAPTILATTDGGITWRTRELGRDCRDAERRRLRRRQSRVGGGRDLRYAGNPAAGSSSRRRTAAPPPGTDGFGEHERIVGRRVQRRDGRLAVGEEGGIVQGRPRWRAQSLGAARSSTRSRSLIRLMAGRRARPAPVSLTALPLRQAPSPPQAEPAEEAPRVWLIAAAVAVLAIIGGSTGAQRSADVR